MAIAVSGPTCAQAVGSVQRTGGLSGSPVQYMFPVEAMTPRSVAFHADRGPSSPNGVTETHTALGAAPGSTAIEPGHPGVSMTASACSRSSVRRGSSGPSTSIVVSPVFHTANRKDVPSVSAPDGGTRRRGSPPFGSTFTTVAPRSARMRPVIAAGSPARLTTRSPCRSASRDASASAVTAGHYACADGERTRRGWRTHAALTRATKTG